jgi:hypothetical protein
MILVQCVFGRVGGIASGPRLDRGRPLGSRGKPIWLARVISTTGRGICLPSARGAAPRLVPEYRRLAYFNRPHRSTGALAPTPLAKSLSTAYMGKDSISYEMARCMPKRLREDRARRTPEYLNPHREIPL